MSAEVEIKIAEYSDVILIPVAAIVENESGTYCWVKRAGSLDRQRIILGDSNEIFSIVTEGLKEGDEVVLNAAFLETPTGATDASVESEASNEPIASNDKA